MFQPTGRFDRVFFSDVPTYFLPYVIKVTQNIYLLMTINDLGAMAVSSVISSI